MNGSLIIEIDVVHIVDRALTLRFGNGSTVQFEDCWLRDHCRCSHCYHPDTYQRAQHILDIPDSRIVEIGYDKHQLRITWDDDHQSVFKADFLKKFHYKTWKEAQRLKPLLWRGQDISKKVARVHVDKFLNSVAGARAVFQSLLDYGIALIEGGHILASGGGDRLPLKNRSMYKVLIPSERIRGQQLVEINRDAVPCIRAAVKPTTEATEKVCVSLGGVQHTIFGGMWEFTTRADHADTAYTNLPLAAHNDNTYFTEAAGLQVLHCLEHSNGSGGETILVDGFYGASCLKTEHPHDYLFLTTFNVQAEYIEDGHHHTYSAPVIKVDKRTRDVEQIRFNVYDRAPMAFESSEECRAYYRSLRSLANYYQDPANQWLFKLQPGTVMVMDNFRVLHGRTGFSGTRVLSGSYISRSDWLDKARSLKLIR